jgi:DNA transformation protein and related proteins
MTDPVSSIPNIGPATEAAFARAGIVTAEQIREMGADAAYLTWLKAGEFAHFIGYYALVLGLQGRPWNDCTPDEKKALRLRFDALKAEAAQNKAPQRSEFEAALDALGVVEKRAAKP